MSDTLPLLPPLPLVLDTNAVLDWLLFRDVRMQPLAAAIEAGRCRWIVSEALRDEIAHVLMRGIASRPGADTSPLWTAWEQRAQVLPAPEPQSLPGLRCTDADDQKFIDFALVQRARWLVSRDRAVLKLRKRARERGLLIVTPEQWQLDT